MQGEDYHAPKHIFGHASQEMTQAVSAEASVVEAAGDINIVLPTCVLHKATVTALFACHGIISERPWTPLIIFVPRHCQRSIVRTKYLQLTAVVLEYNTSSSHGHTG